MKGITSADFVMRFQWMLKAEEKRSIKRKSGGSLKKNQSLLQKINIGGECWTYFGLILNH
jgi:hypothetical protein